VVETFLSSKKNGAGLVTIGSQPDAPSDVDTSKT
jgi:hypothetical protein